MVFVEGIKCNFYLITQLNFVSKVWALFMRIVFLIIKM